MDAHATGLLDDLTESYDLMANCLTGPMNSEAFAAMRARAELSIRNCIAPNDQEVLGAAQCLAAAERALETALRLPAGKPEDGIEESDDPTHPMVPWECVAEALVLIEIAHDRVVQREEANR